MKKKSYRNILFICLSLLTLILISVFNFIVDPYQVFKNKYYMNVYDFPQEYSYISIKAYKDVSCDTVFIGTSEFQSLFQNEEIYRYFFNQIVKNAFSYETQYKLLKAYLNFHPETKNVFIFLTYPMFISESGLPIPDIKGNNFNLKELIFLLLSKESTEKSFNKLKLKKRIDFTDYTNFDFLIYEDSVLNFWNYPDYTFAFPLDKDSVEEIKNFQILNYKKMLTMLKEKNINYKIIIPPYHAIYQSIIYKIPYMQETIDEIKRISTEMSDNDVYDFSVMNKYTTQKYDNTNYLYCDFVHANQIFGFKIFKVLHDNISEKDFYIKLNKTNIEQQIKNSHKQIAKYIAENNKTVSKYMNFYEYINFLYLDCNNKSFDNAPDYIKQEINWYKKKAKNINNIVKQGKKIKKGFWENSI